MYSDLKVTRLPRREMKVLSSFGAPVYTPGTQSKFESLIAPYHALLSTWQGPTLLQVIAAHKSA